MISSTSTLLVAVSLFTAPLPAVAPPPTNGGGAASACTNKSEGDQCSYAYHQNSPKYGQTFSGFCSGGACGAGTQAENPHFACPTVGQTAYTGTDFYKNGQNRAAPLRGNVGCVDFGPLAGRPKGKAGTTVLDATNIYGAMEAGFSKTQPGASCLGAANDLPDFVLPGGVDTNLAEAIMMKACADRGGALDKALLDYCGGHAEPFHYHERMNCLYTADSTTGHSTRIGTAADGNGIYGHNIEGGCEPTDLDWCGGRTGVTPDSNGQEVYYYVVSNRAPFALGCFGPINTEAECRALYPECDGVAQSFTTAHGTDDYDLDCPCFDPVTGSNMPEQGKPNYLGPSGFDAFELDMMDSDRSCNDNDATSASRYCTQAEKDAVSALYSSQKCSSGNSVTPSSSSASAQTTASNTPSPSSASAQTTASSTPSSSSASAQTTTSSTPSSSSASAQTTASSTPSSASAQTTASSTPSSASAQTTTSSTPSSASTPSASDKSNATTPDEGSSIDMSDIDGSDRTTIVLFTLVALVFSVVAALR
jgi:hypothetical protein